METPQIHHALHEALEFAYFSLHFQPKFHSADNRLTSGAEALLRFKHPKMRSLAPMEFIPIAERSRDRPSHHQSRTLI